MAFKSLGIDLRIMKRKKGHGIFHRSYSSEVLSENGTKPKKLDFFDMDSLLRFFYKMELSKPIRGIQKDTLL